MSDPQRRSEPALGLPMDCLPRVQPGAGWTFLQGVRVLDLTTSVAGPFATQLLADFGADVVKLERPGAGDDSRAWGPPFLDDESLWFVSVNRNKRSLALDIAQPEGAAVLRDLIAKCDVMVLNQPPRVTRKLGIDADTVHGIRPDIVYVSITGYGLDGARADWPGYDLIAEGYSGIMDMTGEPDGGPQKIGAPAADMLAGQDAALATVAALFERSRSGRGRVIDVALVDSMTRFLACRIVPYLGSGEPLRRDGGRASVIAVYQPFDTADEPITLGLGNDNLWRRFWTTVGRPERAEDPTTATNKVRRARRAEIVAEIQALLKTRPRAHWLKLLGDARIPCGPINRLDETSADAELVARGLFYCLDDGERHVPQVGIGIRIDGSAATARRMPPRLGEHSEDILRELLDYNDARIEALRRQAII
jgi:crotonobetainyl-CoA:carnitine CoA-transferase CaiB-like acyl-CoA transferase